MVDQFVGKVSVITDASTDIGLATAKRFVEEGMDHVFITAAESMSWMRQLRKSART